MEIQQFVEEIDSNELIFSEASHRWLPFLYITMLAASLVNKPCRFTEWAWQRIVLAIRGKTSRDMNTRMTQKLLNSKYSYIGLLNNEHRTPISTNR